MKFIKLLSIAVFACSSAFANAAFISNDDIDEIIVTVPESYTLENAAIAGSFLFDGDILRRGDSIFRVKETEGLKDDERVGVSDSNSLIIEVFLNRLVTIGSFSFFNDAMSNPDEEISELILELFSRNDSLFVQTFSDLSAEHRDGRFDEQVLLEDEEIKNVNRIVFTITSIERAGEAELREFRLAEIRDFGLSQINAPGALALFTIFALLIMRSRQK